MNPELTQKLTRIESLCRVKDTPEAKSTVTAITAFQHIYETTYSARKMNDALNALTEIAGHFENV